MRQVRARPEDWAGEFWGRLYRLFTANVDGLGRELGDVVAGQLLQEAAAVDRLATTGSYLFVASRPAEDGEER